MRLIGALLLVASVVAVAHWPALSAQTISFDDHEYLVDNALVLNPSWDSARRFLTEVKEPSTVGGYYQPLNMITLMLDVAVGGSPNNLRPFHRTSLALHVLNCCLVSLLIYLLFKNLAVAVMVGLLFGCHPLTVEPIPWIGERKTLLASFFAIWTVLLYVGSVQRKSLGCLLGALIFFVLALMTKPIVVPLPLMLILLDIWPLRVFRWQDQWNKIPFLSLAAVSAGITMVSQKQAALQKTSVYDSFYTISHNLVFYPWKMVWPVDLTSHYSYPDPLDMTHAHVLVGVIGTGLLVVLLGLSCLKTRAMLIGWLIFVIMLLPTMQIKRFSDVIASDKFIYLPVLGLLLVLAAGLARLWRAEKGVRVGLTLAFVSLVVVEVRQTRSYLEDWQNTESHYRRMIRIYPDAAVPHFALGCHLRTQDRMAEARAEFQAAVDCKGNYPQALGNLGLSHEHFDELEKAIDAHRLSVRYLQEDSKTYPKYLANLATALAKNKQYAEAVSVFKRALARQPEDAGTHVNLAVTYYQMKKPKLAMGHFQEALRIQPDHPTALQNLKAIQPQSRE